MKTIVCALGVTVLIAGVAQGLTYTWTGGVSGNMGAVGNWVGGVAPTFNATADLVFRNAVSGNAEPKLQLAGKIARSLTFNANAMSGFRLAFDNANNNVAISLTMGDGSNPAIITVDSGAGNFIVGTSSAGTVWGYIRDFERAEVRVDFEKRKGSIK